MVSWSFVLFCPRKGVALSGHEVRELLRVGGHGSYLASINLGRGVVRVESDGAVYSLNGIRVGRDALEEVAREGEEAVYFLSEEGTLSRVSCYRGGSYYRLKCVSAGSAPTVELSGIHMHNVVRTDPWRDARRKVQLARVRRGMTVLDICTGLGYTAINAVLMGASEVVTIEKDATVLELAECNPWSYALSCPRVTLMLGDAVEVVRDLPPNYFDAAVHDPPTIRIAGELYSSEFYTALRRVLREGATLFHYTGWPGKRRGLNIQAGVVRRLAQAGFKALKVERGYGIVVTV